MLAMEGQRCFRLEPNYCQQEEVIEHKNVIYLELWERLSAFDVCNVLNKYGDIYVVKDSVFSFFIEFSWVDEDLNKDCRTARDLVRRILEEQLFGQVWMISPETQGEPRLLNLIKACMTFKEALVYRKSLT